MHNLKKYMKAEMDTEFFACVHAMSMVFIYGLELYLYGIKSMQYAVIFQIFLLGYVIAWSQKLLFIKDKIYEGLDYKVRIILWNTLPIVLTGIAGFFLNWYKPYPNLIWILFLVIMFVYYIMIWIALQMFYKDDSEELNNKLRNLKKQNERKGVKK
ncbi:MAG: hypothetical protein ACERKZ_19630 [Lachnotalea sp.]